MSGYTRSAAYPWALTGIFAAFHLVMTLIPYTIPVGVEGGKITFGLVSAPTVGFLLGPFFGTVAVLIGSFLALFIDPSIAVLGLFTPLATAAGALTAGAIRKRKHWLAIIITALGLLLYFAGPVGLLAPLYVWLGIVAFVLLLLFMIPRVSTILQSGFEFQENVRPEISILSIWLLSFCAVMADQIIGTATFTYYFIAAGFMDAETMVFVLMNVVFILYPIERIIASVIVTAIVYAVGITLSKTYFDLPAVPGWSEKPETLPLEESEIEETSPAG